MQGQYDNLRRKVNGINMYGVFGNHSRCGTLTHDFERNGTSILFVALDIATDYVIGESYQHHRHQEFLKFLKKAER